MKHDKIEPASSAITATAAVIIDSFVITHSIIVTVIVTVSVLVAVLSGRESVRRPAGDRERS